VAPVRDRTARNSFRALEQTHAFEITVNGANELDGPINAAKVAPMGEITKRTQSETRSR